MRWNGLPNLGHDCWIPSLHSPSCQTASCFHSYHVLTHSSKYNFIPSSQWAMLKTIKKLKYIVIMRNHGSSKSPKKKITWESIPRMANIKIMPMTTVSLQANQRFDDGPSKHSRTWLLEFPGGIVVKDPALSFLWHGFNPWPGVFCKDPSPSAPPPQKKNLTPLSNV